MNEQNFPQQNPYQQQVPVHFRPNPNMPPYRYGPDQQQGYQQPYTSVIQPYTPPVIQPYSKPVQQAQSGAQYVRQQKGHSVIIHVLLAFLTGGFSLLWTLYITHSPNHFWHA